MKKKNIIIVGHGKFAKEYIKVINRINKFNIIFIINNKNKNYFTKNIEKIKKNVEAAIIVTPVKSHYFYARIFIKNKIPIIIEKPVTTNLIQINKLIKISKNRLVLVNHSDLYSKYFVQILDLFKKNKKMIKNIYIQYNKHQIFKKNINSDPAFEWLPHIIAVCLKINGNPKAFKILNKDLKFIRGNIYRKFELIFKYNDFDIKIYYSNFPGISRNRKIIINLLKKNNIIYNDSSINKIIISNNNKKILIRDKKYSTLEELLNFFYKQIKNNTKINDLNFSKIVMKLLFKVFKKLN